MDQSSDDEVLEIIRQGIGQIGFKRVIEDVDKSRKNQKCLIYSISDHVNKCDPEWAIFPLSFSVDQLTIRFKIAFSIEKKYYIVKENTEIERAVKRFICCVNPLLRIGFFGFNFKNRIVSFNITQKALMNELIDNAKLVSKFTDEGVCAYSGFAYGLFRICEKNEKDQGKLIQICQKRYQRALKIALSVNRVKICSAIDLVEEIKIFNKINTPIVKNKAISDPNFLSITFLTNKFTDMKNNDLRLPLLKMNSGKWSNKNVPFTSRYAPLKDMDLDYQLCKKINKVLILLLEKGLKLKQIDSFLDEFVANQGEIFFAYKSQFFDIFQNVAPDEEENVKSEIMEFLSRLLVVNSEKKVFCFSDVFGLSENVRENKYFGMKVVENQGFNLSSGYENSQIIEILSPYLVVSSPELLSR